VTYLFMHSGMHVVSRRSFGEDVDMLMCEMLTSPVVNY